MGTPFSSMRLDPGHGGEVCNITAVHMSMPGHHAASGVVELNTRANRIAVVLRSLSRVSVMLTALCGSDILCRHHHDCRHQNGTLGCFTCTTERNMCGISVQRQYSGVIDGPWSRSHVVT